MAPVLRKWSEILIRAVNTTVFLFLDLLDSVFCVLYCGLDLLLEGRVSSCYCTVTEQCNAVVSETLHCRDNVFREVLGGFVRFVRKRGNIREIRDGQKMLTTRWSDCGCESCASWMSNGGDKLHVAVKVINCGIEEEIRARNEETRGVKETLAEQCREEGNGISRDRQRDSFTWLFSP